MKKHKFSLILLSLATLAVIWLAGASVVKRIEPTNLALTTAQETWTGEITEGMVFCQTLPVEEPTKTLYIRFYTGTDRVNSGTVEVLITGNDSGSTYIHQYLDASGLSSNRFQAFVFSNPVYPETDSFISVTITSDSQPGSAVSLFCSRTDSIREGTFTENGVPIGGDMTLRTEVLRSESAQELQKKRMSVVIWIAVSLMAVTAAAGIYMTLFGKKLPLEVIAFTLVLGFGIVYMMVITPFSVPDEDYHYNSSYQLSNYLLFRSENNYEAGEEADFPYSSFERHYNTEKGFLNGICSFFEEADTSGETIIIPNPRKVGYFLKYLLPAFGIALGRLLNLNFIRLFLLGRFMNLLLYAFCVYFAVRRIPRFKMVIAVVALFPMAMQQAASFSYDAFTNGLAFLMIASLFRAIWDEGKLTLRDILWFLIPGMVMAPAKMIYVIFFLLVFFIPKERFRRPERKFAACVLMLAACAGWILLFCIPTILRYLTPSEGEAGASGSGMYTVGFILEHPKSTVRVFVKSIIEKRDWYFRSMIASLSGTTLTVSIKLVWGFFTAAVLAAVTEKDVRFPALLRLTCLILSLAIFGLALLAMFLSSTPYSAPVIVGYQGRYMIPAEPLLYMAFFLPFSLFGKGNGGKKGKKGKKGAKKGRSVYAQEEIYSVPVHSRMLFILCAVLELYTVLAALNYTLVH